MVLLIIGIIILGGLLLLPNLWAKSVMKKHGKDRPDCPGTGGELAEHLVQEFGLDGVKVEALPGDGDHYDPDAKAIRLSPDVYNGRSVTAVTVAAHEFGHAMQDHDGSGGLRRRTVLVKQAYWFDRIGSVVLFAAPILMFLPGLRALGFGFIILGVALSLVRVAVHLVTLPVEIDASFGKALPILERGEYLPAREMPAARNILRACAMTYVAASLWSLLNLLRWIRR